MPVINARAGLTPTATAIPMHKGNATRKTTIDAKKSSLKWENMPSGSFEGRFVASEFAFKI
jgi:hypothetical protein